MSWKLPWSPTGIPKQVEPQAVQDNFKALESRLSELGAAGERTVVTSAATAAEGPSALGTDLTYTAVEVTLTPGLWLVYGQATLTNGMALDGMQLALWNNTSGVEIANSTGPVGVPAATGGTTHVTTTAVVTISASTAVRLRGRRNGSSTVAFGYGGGTLSGEQRITAVRIG